MDPARLVMLGPPGAGKGTQADRFARERGVPRVSTGDIIREAVTAGTELGRAAGALIDAGHFVSDEIAIGIVRERLAGSDAARGWVLDGFPRTLPQAAALDGLIGLPFVVVDIEVPEDTLVHRLALRRVCSRCGATAEPGAVRCAKCGGELVQRADDDRDVVRERLRVYARQTRPIVEFYRGRSTFRTVNGDQPPDIVAAKIAEAVAAAEGGRA
jgi:adenylate kinase